MSRRGNKEQWGKERKGRVGRRRGEERGEKGRQV
jgi:hypothetical protein